MAGLLHDLGNVGVDDELFLAPRQLTEAEIQQMRGHASIGAEILREVGALRHLMAGPLYHHERYDGGGYPQGLAGDGIPLLARIVAVAEAFDALRSARPYRPAMNLADALAQIRAGQGTVFDPRIVHALLAAHQRGRLPAQA
jgi:HD-GYP domain-containing protein (c-di-GMP phosphodiesterase class II)